MKYHALFVIFEKSGKTFNCRLLQIIGGTIRVNFEKKSSDNEKKCKIREHAKS